MVIKGFWLLQPHSYLNSSHSISILRWKWPVAHWVVCCNDRSRDHQNVLELYQDPGFLFICVYLCPLVEIETGAPTFVAAQAELLIVLFWSPLSTWKPTWKPSRFVLWIPILQSNIRILAVPTSFSGQVWRAIFWNLEDPNRLSGWEPKCVNSWENSKKPPWCGGSQVGRLSVKRLRSAGRAPFKTRRMSSWMWNPVTGKLPTIHMHIAQKRSKRSNECS